MLEILQKFEQTAPKLAPLVLILPGLAAAVIGLLVWLGGLGFRKLLAALVSAFAGGIAGFFLIRRNIASVALAAGIAALVGLVFQRVFIAVLAAALATAFGFMVLAWPHIQPAGTEPANSEPEIARSTQSLAVRQSIETVKSYAVDFGYAVKRMCLQMPIYNWAILAAVAAAFAGAGLYLWRLTLALCCAAVGTTLIFAGMILLLAYKGAAPITKLSGGNPVYGGIFLGMITFGAVEQWLLCGRTRKQPAKTKSNKPESQPEEKSWRNV